VQGLSQQSSLARSFSPAAWPRLVVLVVCFGACVRTLTFVSLIFSAGNGAPARACSHRVVLHVCAIQADLPSKLLPKNFAITEWDIVEAQVTVCLMLLDQAGSAVIVFVSFAVLCVLRSATFVLCCWLRVVMMFQIRDGA
jgi:hypothetical protein